MSALPLPVARLPFTRRRDKTVELSETNANRLTVGQTSP